jgi:hypothetical protein
MKLSEIFSQVMREGFLNKRAMLLNEISLDNGETRKKGDVVYILSKCGENKYRAEHNEWACIVSGDEIKFLE